MQSEGGCGRQRAAQARGFASACCRLARSSPVGAGIVGWLFERECRGCLFIFEEDGGRQVAELVAAVEAGDLEDEEEAKDGTLALLNEVGCGFCRATC